MENVLVVDQFVVGFVLNYTAFIALGKHDKGKNKVKKQSLLKPFFDSVIDFAFPFVAFCLVSLGTEYNFISL